jgi:hypothetical protein
VLLLALAAQAAYHFRDSIVTFWPVTRPTFERVCEVAGCVIRPLRDDAMSYLSIEASDLQADPAHRGLLILTATVRNRASWPLAYPHLELTLTDAQDRVVVRRALAQPTTPPERRTSRAASGPGGNLAQGVHRRERHLAGGLPAVHVLSVTTAARRRRFGDTRVRVAWHQVVHCEDTDIF